MEFDRFTVVLLVSGPTPNTDELQDAHLAHLASLHETGALLAAGPLRDPAGELRGLSILSVPLDEALRLKREDPAVQAGVFTLRAFEWNVPADAIRAGDGVLPSSMADVLGE